MGSALNAQQPPLPPGQEPLPQPPREIVLQPNGRQAAPTPPPERAPVDMVRDPNFGSALAQQDYMNTLAQLVADRQARGEMPGLMPIGGTGISAEQMQNLSPERRMALDERMAMQPRTPTLEELRASRKIPAPMPPLEQGTVGAMPPTQERSKELEIFNKLRRGEQLTPEEQLIDINLQRKVPAPTPPQEVRPPAPQMQNYNQILQQGMRRNRDMNQAAQNLVAPAGPARSFSQVAGRTRRTPMPRPPANNSLAPSNRRLI